jgi:hypothetical protein
VRSRVVNVWRRRRSKRHEAATAVARGVVQRCELGLRDRVKRCWRVAAVAAHLPALYRLGHAFGIHQQALGRRLLAC